MEKPQKDSIAAVFLTAMLEQKRDWHLHQAWLLEKQISELSGKQQINERGRPKGWTDEMIKSVHDAISTHQKQHGITQWWMAVYSWLTTGNPGADPSLLERFADDIAKNHVPKKLKPKNSNK